MCGIFTYLGVGKCDRCGRGVVISIVVVIVVSGGNKKKIKEK